jgi:heme/copper-type cytochrome/quinol oxidase subunit 4
MKSLVRSNVTLAWLILSALTVVSWMLVTDHGLGGDHHVPASLAIIAIAVIKIRLAGLYFMELKDAPLQLRGIFEGYCVVLFALLTSLYAFAA